MQSNHVVVWIDHAVAHIQHFDADKSALHNVFSKSKHPHVHTRAGACGSGKDSDNIVFFDEIAADLAGSGRILIVGPASEKLEFQKHLAKAHAAIAKSVVAVETVDHPTDGEVLKYARKYFVHADRMQPV